MSRQREWVWKRHGCFEYLDHDGTTVLGDIERAKWGGKWLPQVGGVAIGPAVDDVDEAERAVVAWIERRGRSA